MIDPPEGLSVTAAAAWVEQVMESGETPESLAVLELYAIQMGIARDSAAAVARDGQVVEDLKGNFIPHPSVSIGEKASAAAAKLLAQRPRRR